MAVEQRESAEISTTLLSAVELEPFKAARAQIVAAGHVDESQIHLAPVLLGAGTRIPDRPTAWVCGVNSRPHGPHNHETRSTR